MAAESLLSGLNPEWLIDRIADALIETGYAVLPVALPASMSDALFTRIDSFDDAVFHAAGVGRGKKFQLKSFVRNDRIRWLSAGDEVEAGYLAWMETLRVGLNRRLFMGLFDYECHFARYVSGAFYKKHVDAFRGRTNRVLSTVLYLNPNWSVDDGGYLRIYDDTDELIANISPLMGTLVVFLSDRFPHEVTTTRRLRYSIAGWFRVNTSLGPHSGPLQ